MVGGVAPENSTSVSAIGKSCPSLSLSLSLFLFVHNVSESGG